MSGRHRLRGASVGPIRRGRAVNPATIVVQLATVAVATAADAVDAADDAQADATQALNDAAAAQGDATQALNDAAAAQTAADDAQADADTAIAGNPLHGSGPPSGGLGVDGNIYIDESDGSISGKGGGNWVPV